MAKGLNWKKSITETISVKGNLNETATEITYLDEDKEEQTIAVQELLNKFASCAVSMSIKMQTDEELDIEQENEYVPEDDVIDLDDLQ
jgi:hypothetical protein